MLFLILDWWHLLIVQRTIPSPFLMLCLTHILLFMKPTCFQVSISRSKQTKRITKCKKCPRQHVFLICVLYEPMCSRSEHLICFMLCFYQIFKIQISTIQDVQQKLSYDETTDKLQSGHWSIRFRIKKLCKV